MMTGSQMEVDIYIKTLKQRVSSMKIDSELTIRVDK